MVIVLQPLGFQELKNMRSQLYSAAEYFELSYSNDDQNQMYALSLDLPPLLQFHLE